MMPSICQWIDMNNYLWTGFILLIGFVAFMIGYLTRWITEKGKKEDKK